LKPDQNNDWINLRDPNYKSYPCISGADNSPFKYNNTGIVSSRDAWVCGFNKEKVLSNAHKLIDNYNEEIDRLKTLKKKLTKDDLNYDPTKLNWSEELKKAALKFKKIKYYPKRKLISYRPFVKKWIYFDKALLHRRSNYYETWGNENKVIVTTGTGSSRSFSGLITDNIPDYQFMMNGQGFPEFNNQPSNELILNRDNINVEFAKKNGLAKEEVIPFIYALLNSPDYQKYYANDLKKDLAHIPPVYPKKDYIK
nr:helicase [Lactobacillus amylovorus]